MENTSLTLQDMYAFLSEKWDSEERAVFHLALFQGLRCNEIYDLKWENIDFDKFLITANGRTRRLDVITAYLLQDCKRATGERVFSRFQTYNSFRVWLTKKLKNHDGITISALNKVHIATMMGLGIGNNVLCKMLGLSHSRLNGIRQPLSEMASGLN